MPNDLTTNSPTKSWLKVTITAPEEAVDAIASFVATLTGNGVEYTNQPDSNSSVGHEKVIGYITNDSARASQETQLRNFLTNVRANMPEPNQAALTLHTELIEDEDWNKAWKKHFKPIKITPRLVIKPTWEPYVTEGDETVIEMDPGMAFGTGHHASTKLALECIESLFFTTTPSPKKVLDVGSGTGILGMACAKFGAQQIVAVDNDPEAVAVAKENVANNGLAEIIEVSSRELASLSGPFDLIIANITHDVLKALAPSISSLLGTSGHLVLSGLLREGQLDSIRAIYEQQHLTPSETRVLDEWGALIFVKHRPSPEH